MPVQPGRSASRCAAHALARQVERRPVGARRRERLALDVGHPQVARAGGFVEQPHAAGVALGVVDQPLDEHAEEAAACRARVTSRSSASCTASLWIAPCTRPAGGRRRSALQRRAQPASPRRRLTTRVRGRSDRCRARLGADMAPDYAAASRARHSGILPDVASRPLVADRHRLVGRTARLRPIGTARAPASARLWRAPPRPHAVEPVWIRDSRTSIASFVTTPLVARAVIRRSPLAGCSQPVGQQASRRPPRRRSPSPRPSPATSPNGTSSPAGSRRCNPSRSGRACPARLAVSFEEGASCARASCCSRSTTGRSRPRSIGCAPSWRRPRATARPRRLRAAARRAAGDRERDVARGARAPRQRRREAGAQVAAVEAALRAAELDLEFTRVISPIDGRVGRAIVTAGNLVSSGPGEATLLTTVVSLDPIYAVVRRRRADLPALRRSGPRRQARQRAPVGPADPDGAGRRATASRARARWTSSTTSSIRRPARSAAAPSSAIPTGGSRRACSCGCGCPARPPTAACWSRTAPSAPTSTGASCFVVGADKTVESRTVTLGPMVDGLRVVRSGLTAGELVVVNGLQRVRPGCRASNADASVADGRRAVRVLVRSSSPGRSSPPCSRC